MAQIDEASVIQFVENIAVSYLKRHGVPTAVWDDAIQEALLKMVVLLPKYDPAVASLMTFLYVPVVGAVIDSLRRTEGYTRGKVGMRSFISIEHYRQNFDPFFLDLPTVYRDENPEERYLRDVESPRRASEVLSRLEGRDLAVVEMLYLREMGPTEAAGEAGLSVSRIAQIKAQALKCMREEAIAC